jgi:hypothetical protein
LCTTVGNGRWAGPGTHNKCEVVLHIHISNTAEMRAPPTHTETDRGSAPTDHRVSEATHTLNRAFAMSSHATLCMYDLYVLKVCTSLDTESRLDAPVSGLPSMGKDHQFASTVIPLTKDLTSQMERTHQPSSTYHVSETLLVYCPKVKRG